MPLTPNQLSPNPNQPESQYARRRTTIAIVIIVLVILVITSTCYDSVPDPTPVPAFTFATTSESGLTPTAAAIESPTPESAAVVEQPITPPSDLRVVYLRDGNLWLWNEANENVMLTGTGDLSAVRLSEDGQLLAFMRGLEIWTIRMDGTDARPWVTQAQEGCALWFSPDGSFLAVSTADHIDIVDLASGATKNVLNYSLASNGYYPEVVWAADSTGFKTVLPPGSEKGQAEFLFIMNNGTKASLAKFSMVPVSESFPYISPDGGYVIYAGASSDEKESLYLMDSSGATRPYGQPATNIFTFGWLPDSQHFLYALNNERQALLGVITGEPRAVLSVNGYSSIRWLDSNRFLAMQEDKLELNDIKGDKTLIAEDVAGFDFWQ